MALQRQEDGGQCFVFVFPTMVGHVNPSLPLARRLLGMGHSVHYICHEPLRAKIEGTGASYHSAVECYEELYGGRGNNFFSMFAQLKAEYGIDPEKTLVALWQLRHVMMEMQLPGLLRLLRRVGPGALVFCPISCPEAAAAAKILGVPSVALNTFAGPGAVTKGVLHCLRSEGVAPAELSRLLLEWPPNSAAIERLKGKYGLGLEVGRGHLGFYQSMADASLTLVTTSCDLQEPMDPELAGMYEEAGAVFEAVGPLLEPAGAWRPLGAEESGPGQEVLDRVRAARAAGRRVVLVSMGTVVTGNMPNWGWNGRPLDAAGHPRGLSGRELCHAAWSGAFDAFGADAADSGALVVLALGPQPDALTGLAVPPNVAAAAFLPQVDILREGVAVFLTHGGQNSFTEALVHGTPVVVCPGFSDQFLNSDRAVKLGVGLGVDRPDPDAGGEGAAAARYRVDVGQALREVAAQPRFRAAAERYGQQLAQAGGVPRAAALVLAAAGRAEKAAEGPRMDSDATAGAGGA